MCQGDLEKARRLRDGGGGPRGEKKNQWGGGGAELLALILYIQSIILPWSTSAAKLQDYVRLFFF